MEPKTYSYIRFSSKKQEEGDSERRQLQATRQYIQEKRLPPLDTTITMIDRGMSAYHGIHRRKGALGVFLQAVRDGTIVRGSVLLIENFDRLTREKPLDAIQQVDQIVRAGIRVITLTTRQEFTLETLNENPGLLYSMVGDILRANAESERKSRMLRAVWENKRKNGDKVPLTRMVPAWVKVQRDGTMSPRPEVCRAIELIYRKRAAGKGKTIIEQEMNDDHDVWKPPATKRNKTGGWRTSYIDKLLHTREVIGEYQPHRLKYEGATRKRVPAGPPLKNYYPPAISQELFYQVQQVNQRQSRNAGYTGGRPDLANNLFRGLVYCVCGSKMHFINKGKPPKGGTYLVCDRARRLHTCTEKPVRYDEFETLFLTYFTDLNVDNILPTGDEYAAEINQYNQTLCIVQARLRELTEAETNTVDSIAMTKNPDVRRRLEIKLSELLDEKENVEKQSKQLTQQISELKSQRDEFCRSKEKITEIFELLKSGKPRDRIELRFKLRNEIQNTVSKIKLASARERRSGQLTVRAFKVWYTHEGQDKEKTWIKPTGVNETFSLADKVLGDVWRRKRE